MGTQRRIALATYAGAPDLAPDDRSLVPALAALGIEGVPAQWADPAVRWGDFDAVMIRSCWDYHLRVGDFLGWLDRLEATGRPVWNSPGLVRWNADKRYLIDLASHGIATVPTIVIPRGAGETVGSSVAERGWPRFVLKPAVSASGYETHLLRMPLSDDARATIARVTTRADALVQPYVEDVARNGELSFTFIDGAFSHAAVKRAAAGEFRVQTEHGGSVDAVSATAAVVREAARVLEVLPERPLYARVDGVVSGASFLLMELELIEPNLFLEHSDGGADRLAAAITARISD